jgi:hypothetical protein
MPQIKNEFAITKNNADALASVLIPSPPLTIPQISRLSRPHTLWIVKYVFRIDSPFDMFKLQ